MNGRNGVFGARLSLLFHAAGTPPAKAVVRAVNRRTSGTANITEQRISAWRRAQRVPATFEAARPMLEVLIEAAQRAGTTDIDRSLLDMRHWHRAWEASRPEARTVVLDPDREPYRGLAAFRTEDADLFFGRAAALRRLTELVATATADGGSPVLLLGPSGVGKSSLLTAGLQAQPGTHVPVLLHLGAEPVAALRTALAEAGGSNRLILIDQAEQLFTRSVDRPERVRFLDELRALAATDVIVMAVDVAYLPDILEDELLATALRERSMLLGPMTDDELRQAITAPAAAVGLRVEPQLVDVVLSDIHSAASPDRRAALLPLLSHVLWEIWSKRRGKTLTLDLYRAAGGVSGAIAASAERVWSELDDADHDIARRLLIALTLVGPRVITRNRVPQDILVGESADPRRAAAIIAEFVAARLLVHQDGEVEIVHDALLSGWPRMANWLLDEAEFAPARQRIEDDARTWQAGERPPALLYDNGRLHHAIELDTRTGALNRIAREFVVCSARAAARRTRLRRILSVATSLLVVTVVALTLAVLVQRSSAAEQHRQQAVGAVVAEAERLRSSDPGTSAQLILAAYRMNPDDPAVQTRLVGTQAQASYLTAPDSSGGRATVVAYAPNGIVAAGSVDGAVRLWRSTERSGADSVAQLPDAHAGAVTALAFGSGGDRLATAGQDHRLRLWDVRRIDAARPLGTIDTGSTAQALSSTADGRTVLLAGDDGTLATLDVTDPMNPRIRGSRIAAHPGPIREMDVDARGTRVATTDGTTVRLWRLNESGDPVPQGTPLTGFPSTVRALSFGPDSLLALGISDGTVQLWQVDDTGAARHAATRHTVGPGVSALDFDRTWLIAVDDTGIVTAWDASDPDDPRLGPWVGQNATGRLTAVQIGTGGRTVEITEDGQLRIWSPPPGLLPIPVSTAPTSIALGRGGTLLAIGQRGGVELWDVTDAPHATRVSRIADTALDGDVRVALRAEGNLLAAKAGTTTRLWDLGDPARPVEVGAPMVTGPVDIVAFGPRGRLVTGSGATALQLWDVSDPARPVPLGAPLTGADRAPTTVAFDRDASRLAAAGSDNRIYRWDITDWANPTRVQPLDTESVTTAMVFAPDGQHLFTGGADGYLRTWDVPTGRQVGKVPAHDATVGDLTIDDSGHRLISSGRDATVTAWNAENPARPAKLGEPATGSLVRTTLFVRFDEATRTRLLGIGRSGSMVWQLDPADVAAGICQRSTDPLTPRLWHELLPSVPYVDPCPGGTASQ